MYEIILAHAQLDRINHAHGVLRDNVKKDGTGNAGSAAAKLAKLDAAWTNLFTAHQGLAKPNPGIAELQQALDGIDHGSGGGMLP